MYSSSPFIFSLLLLFSIPAIFFVGPRILPPKTLPSIPDPTRPTTSPSSAAPPSPPPPPFASRLPPPPQRSHFYSSPTPTSPSPPSGSSSSAATTAPSTYIHLDPNSKLNSSLLTPSFVGRFIPAKATQRGSPTLISAARRLLAAALLDDPSNAFFALISQHCVPLHSFRFVYRTLFSSPAASPARASSRSSPPSPTSGAATSPAATTSCSPRSPSGGSASVPVLRPRPAARPPGGARPEALEEVQDAVPQGAPGLVLPGGALLPTLLSMLDSEGCTHYA
ncbi:uncharacterized protein M6B38_284750 [Iris pallida]|uniref:Uncharacterized protein n=1 Tax=Iris pallida TaxID=29817 RepID=A0AAX6I237_IRIPA|nr:uncharacterized protein M6B38_284750 [Iris pallida]